MHPVFSVIIVTFKRVDHLIKAIDSVLNQTLTQYECLIFNDFPQDNENVKKVVDGLNDKRFSFIASHSSKGANHWRNTGVKMAKGDYIAFLDDDDQWFPEKLAEHHIAHKSDKAFLVYSDYIKIWPEANYPDVPKQNATISKNINGDMANGNFSISTTSSVSLLNQIHWELFDESLESFQDWDAWFNLTMVHPDAKFHHIKRPLVCYADHGNNKVSKNHERRWKALQQLKIKYQKKKVDISGFLLKEKLNLLLMELKSKNLSKLFMVPKLSAMLVANPLFFRYSYTYRRIGRFIFKDEDRL